MLDGVGFKTSCISAPLVDDPRLCSVLGIAIDAARRRIWAVNSDLGASVRPSAVGLKKLAGVGVYELDSGKPLHYVDLTSLAKGPHLLNGIALDASGTAFVTDSFSPIIYRVTAGGDASIFLEGERFSGTGVNLSGLVVHPDGYLLVIKKSDGTLYKVPLERPESAFEKGRPVIVHEGQSLQDLRAIPHVLFRNVEASRPLEFVIAYVVPRGAPVVSIP